jgi:hypothetical protein
MKRVFVRFLLTLSLTAAQNTTEVLNKQREEMNATFDLESHSKKVKDYGFKNNTDPLMIDDTE